MVKVYFVYSRQQLSLNVYTKIPFLTTSWYLILWTVLTNVFGDHGCFPLCAGIYRSRSFHFTPTVYDLIGRQSSASISIYSHQIVCCVIFSVLLVLLTIIKCVYTNIFSMATFAESGWCMWYLHYSNVSVGGILDKAPIILLDSDPLMNCWVVCRSTICWCGSEEEDDNENKWEVLGKMIMKRSGKSWGIYS